MYKTTLAIFLVFILILSTGLTRADAVYKWVDAQGNIHYTDHPIPGAQKVKLPKTQTYAAPSSTGMPTLPAPASTAAPTAAYAQFSITAPASQANLWYADEVTVSVSLSPELRPGDTLTYELDGQTIGPTSDTSVTFKGVPRGEHTVSATLNATNGGSMSAGPITFYIKQKTALGPKPPR